jgi:pimeloyl-ACP methyl ester carboxylesterase
MAKNNELNSSIESLIEQNILQMDGYEVHYNISGNGNDDLIIFLHPAFSDHRIFDLQIGYFSKHYKVITIDLIGHGLSKANKSKDKIDASTEHIRKILEKEGIDNVHLVGVSMGSLIAQHFALEYSEKAKSLTALGGYNINKKNKEVEKAQKSSNFSLVIRAILSMDSFRKKAAEITCKSQQGQALFYKSASLYDRKSFMVMAGLENLIKDRKLIEPSYPILILTGEYDIDLAIKMSKEWQSEIGNAMYYMIKNAGHCANIDNPMEFNKVVKDFIDTNND